MQEENKGDKIRRVLQLYAKLSDGYVINKAEEAAYYGVTERSITRDIDDIRNFLDEDSERTGIVNNVVYDRMAKGYRLETLYKIRLQNSEVLALCKILLDSRAFTKNEMVSMLDKLITCCVPKVNQKRVKELIQNEEFHYVEPKHGNEFIDLMWDLGQAINESRYIEIDYLRTKDKAIVHRRLQPVAIMFSEYYFYLTAFIEDEEVRKGFDVINDSFPTIYRRGVSKAVSFGGNVGANFARSSTTTAMLGKNEGITQNYTNFNVQHALELLKEQMKRFEQSTALGMWDFAAYVLSEDPNVANNVAHSYLALTLGEDSYMSKSAINTWRGNVEDEAGQAKEITEYIKMLRHPLFGLNPGVVGKVEDDEVKVEVDEDTEFIVYPPIVTATTSLSGKELAYSLNFPQKSIAGLPVLECVEFGRNVVTYDEVRQDAPEIGLGNVFHMNHTENTKVSLSKKSLASHTFITGSTGSGKSNTVYHMLDRARKQGVKFLVVEPAKGEYKNVFGGRKDVTVLGTNPKLSQLLRINPFSFPENIHVLEHMDRLVEIFNVCWPMYAAMPAVLKNAVEKSYVDCGWDIVKSENKYGEELYPSFADVARNVKEIIDSSEYDAENKGAYKGSLLTRLQSLCNGINGMIFVADEIPKEQLFEENVIVDLSRVGSSETKSLIMGMMVLKLQEYRMSSATGMNAELNHITVLEEAHNLLRRTSNEQSAEGSNLLGKSVEMLSNAIAEMRTYGEGFIIADQAPGLMDMSVIRNTNTKIILRLPDQADRELVGRAANLNEDQITELAKLPCGVAAVYQNEWIQPVLCKVDLFAAPEKPFMFDPDDNDLDNYCKTEVEESLLNCIMEKEILRRGNKTDLKALKSKIIKSKLETCVKRDFMEYLEHDGENAIETLRKLIYDFLSAENAIIEAKQCNDIVEWTRTVVDRLNPSLRAYPNKQIDLALALILYEQTLRDASYGSVFCKFTEVYKNEGGVF